MNSAGDLRERNIGAIFDALDADAGGMITAADVSRMAALACDQLGLTGTAKGTELAGIWASWWEQLAADASAGGRISRADFVAAHMIAAIDPGMGGIDDQVGTGGGRAKGSERRDQFGLGAVMPWRSAPPA